MARRQSKNQRAARTPPRQSTSRSDAPSEPDWQYPLLALAVIAAIIWAIYIHNLDAPFVFDDRHALIENPSIKRLWPLVGTTDLPGPLTLHQLNSSPVAGRPLVNLTFALNYCIHGLAPSGYRAVNVCLHIFTATLLALVVRRTLRLPYFGGRFARSSGVLAIAVAIVWAVHPLVAEPVMYITQRTEQLVVLCYLATLYCSLRYWAATNRASRVAWLGLATGACWAGMASKEVMVSAPLIVLLFERCFVAASTRKALRRSWSLYLALSSSWILLAAIHLSAPRSNTTGFGLGISATEWWATQCQVLLQYLGRVLWPSQLLIHYYLPFLDSARDACKFVLPVALLAAVAVWALWRNRPLGFLLAWFGAALAPTFVIPIYNEVASDRRMYLPLMATAIFAVVGTFVLAEHARSRSRNSSPRLAAWQPLVAVGAIWSIVALTLALASAARAGDYRNPLGLWERAATVQPDDFMAQNNLASELLRLGRREEAAEHYQAALRVKPDCSESHFGLGLYLAELERYSEALDHFQLSLHGRPRYAPAENNIGAVYSRTDQPETALLHFRRAIELDPALADSHSNLAKSLFALGQTSSAIASFQRACVLEPDNPIFQANLAEAYRRTGQFANAVAPAERAARLYRAAGDEAAAAKIEARSESSSR